MAAEKIGVVGAGLMGAEIAHVFALAGHDVVLSDRTDEQLAAASNRLATVLDRGIPRGFFREEDREPALARIRTTTALEPNPTASIANVTANEGNAGNTPFTFNVTLSAPSGSPVTIDYATANGSAIAGTDYAAASGTLTFPVGVTSQPITVNVIGDTQVEPDRTFFVNLSNATGATIVTAQATGTIVDDDVAAALPIQVPTLAEWGLALAVTLLGGIGLIALRRR